MIATPKFPAKSLPPSVVRPDIAKPVTGVLPSIPGTLGIQGVTANPKPPPPMVPIGPPMPEGQLPPYAIPKQPEQQEQLSKAPAWAHGVFSKVERDMVHTLPPVLAPLPALLRDLLVKPQGLQARDRLHRRPHQKA